MKKWFELLFTIFALVACSSEIPKEGDPTVKSIAVKENTVPTEFYVGNMFSVTGGKLLVTYSNEKISEVNMTLSMINNVPSMNTPLSNYQVSVSYKEKTTSYTINVYAKDVYTLNATSKTVEVGETFQFKLYKNGTQITNNVLWQVSSDLIEITNSGILKGIYPTGNTKDVFVRGSVGSNYVDCPITVIGRNNSIYRCMTSEYGSSAELEEGTNHVHYSHSKTVSGSNWDGTKYKHDYSFDYDSLTEKCKIQVTKIGYYVNDDGYQWEEVYVGYNVFTWGDYENGQFYGTMGDILHDTSTGTVRQCNVSFINSQMVFNKAEYTYGIHTSGTYYQILTIKESDIQDIFHVVYECKTFADSEVFKSYNSAHPSDKVTLF